MPNKHRDGLVCSAKKKFEKRSTKGLQLNQLIQTIKVNGHTGTLVKDSKLCRIQNQLEDVVQE